MGTDFENFRNSNCQICGNKMIFYTHRFQPPTKNDLDSWKVIEFLKENGFKFQHIYDESIIQTYVPYPKTMREAKEFVLRYKDQAKNE